MVKIADTPYGNQMQVPDAGTTAPEEIPAGGTTGQALVKLSNADFDMGWQSDTDHGLPAGGATNTVLSKVNGTDFNAGWRDIGASDLPFVSDAVGIIVVDDTDGHTYRIGSSSGTLTLTQVI